MTGEFYRLLIIRGPELIAYAQFYEAVKAALKEAAAEFNYYYNLKPEHRSEWIERCIEKWFGVPPIRVKTPDGYAPYNGHKNGKPDFQKTKISENLLSKPDCFGTPFPTDENISECQLCPYLDACCKDALRMEAKP